MSATEFQTRRESGEIRQFQTLREAIKDCEDPEVWKLSFQVGEDEFDRVRLVRNDAGEFVLEDIWGRRP